MHLGSFSHHWRDDVDPQQILKAVDGLTEMVSGRLALCEQRIAHIEQDFERQTDTLVMVLAALISNSSINKAEFGEALTAAIRESQAEGREGLGKLLADLAGRLRLKAGGDLLPPS
jgi:hypothetical protein